ncbi:hypothetical protein BDY24DRAFT_428114 [Mrakia frigida]|uniref:uncharacterized protein n=1 Tax=Mrakia frigida TaxID=29902 RepID=UPI003FCC0893
MAQPQVPFIGPQNLPLIQAPLVQIPNRLTQEAKDLARHLVTLPFYFWNEKHNFLFLTVSGIRASYDDVQTHFLPLLYAQIAAAIPHDPATHNFGFCTGIEPHQNLNHTLHTHTMAMVPKTSILRHARAFRTTFRGRRYHPYLQKVYEAKMIYNYDVDAFRVFDYTLNGLARSFFSRVESERVQKAERVAYVPSSSSFFSSPSTKGQHVTGAANYATLEQEFLYRRMLPTMDLLLFLSPFSLLATSTCSQDCTRTSDSSSSSSCARFWLVWFLDWRGCREERFLGSEPSYTSILLSLSSPGSPETLSIRCSPPTTTPDVLRLSLSTLKALSASTFHLLSFH